MSDINDCPYGADEGFRLEERLDWGCIRICRSPAERGWPQLFGFQFLLPPAADRSPGLPPAGVPHLQAGAQPQGPCTER